MMIQFNAGDPKQMDAVDFLNACGYKKNRVLSIMVKEFVEFHNLKSLDKEYLKRFIDSYDFINDFVKNAVKTQIVLPVQPAVENSVPVVEPVDSADPSGFNSIETAETQVDDKKADAALAAFGL